MIKAKNSIQRKRFQQDNSTEQCTALQKHDDFPKPSYL